MYRLSERERGLDHFYVSVLGNFLGEKGQTMYYETVPTMYYCNSVPYHAGLAIQHFSVFKRSSRGSTLLKRSNKIRKVILSKQLDCEQECAQPELGFANIEQS